MLKVSSKIENNQLMVLSLTGYPNVSGPIVAQGRNFWDAITALTDVFVSQLKVDKITKKEESEYKFEFAMAIVNESFKNKDGQAEFISFVERIKLETNLIHDFIDYFRDTTNADEFINQFMNNYKKIKNECFLLSDVIVYYEEAKEELERLQNEHN